MTTGCIERDGFEIAYVVEGQGPPIVIIGSTKYYPRTFSAALRNAFTLVFIDHRGFSRCSSVSQPGPDILDQVVEDVDAVIATLGLDRFAVLGHSGHGYLAMSYAHRYPAKVSHVTVVATGPSHAPVHAAETERHWETIAAPERKRIFNEDMAGLAAELARAPDRMFITFCLRMRARSWYDPSFDATALWDGVTVNMPVIDALWGKAFTAFDPRAALNAIQAPVLLLHGVHDYLVAPHWTWLPYQKEARDLTIRLFEKSAHTPQLEQGELFDRILMDALLPAERRSDEGPLPG